MQNDDEELIQPEDPTVLTDLDWVTINELKRKHGHDPKKLMEAFEKLGRDKPEQFSRIMQAFAPITTREAARDAAAALGLDRDDIERMRKDGEHQPGEKKKH